MPGTTTDCWLWDVALLAAAAVELLLAANGVVVVVVEEEEEEEEEMLLQLQQEKEFFSQAPTASRRWKESATEGLLMCIASLIQSQGAFWIHGGKEGSF